MGRRAAVEDVVRVSLDRQGGDQLRLTPNMIACGGNEIDVLSRERLLRDLLLKTTVVCRAAWEVKGLAKTVHCCQSCF